MSSGIKVPIFSRASIVTYIPYIYIGFPPFPPETTLISSRSSRNNKRNPLTFCEVFLFHSLDFEEKDSGKKQRFLFQQKSFLLLERQIKHVSKSVRAVEFRPSFIIKLILYQNDVGLSAIIRISSYPKCVFKSPFFLSQSCAIYPVSLKRITTLIRCLRN